MTSDGGPISEVTFFPSSTRGLEVWRSEWTPPKAKAKSLTAAQAAGLAFERKVGKSLSLWAKARTFRLKSQLCLEDARGIHIPDFIVLGPSRGLLVEVKLSFTEEGDLQLRRYAPAVASMYNVDLVLCQVCKVVNQKVGEREILSGDGVLDTLWAAKNEGPYIYHAPWGIGFFESPFPSTPEGVLKLGLD